MDVSDEKSKTLLNSTSNSAEVNIKMNDQKYLKRALLMALAICCDLPSTVQLSVSPMRTAVLPRFALDLWWQVERVAEAPCKQQ
ncbi:hypothetical protein ACOMHN_016622 [Nucella lapillus]